VFGTIAFLIVSTLFLILFRIDKSRIPEEIFKKLWHVYGIVSAKRHLHHEKIF